MLCENALSLWWHMALVFLLPSHGLKSWEWFGVMMGSNVAVEWRNWVCSGCVLSMWLVRFRSETEESVSGGLWRFYLGQGCGRVLQPEAHIQSTVQRKSGG